MCHDDRPISAAVAVGPNRPYRPRQLRSCRQQRAPRQPFARSHTLGHQHRLLRRNSRRQRQQCRLQHGVPTNAATAQAWTNTYRRMRHGFATGNLGRHLFYLTYHARSLANHFTNLKIARETTDYDPNRILTAGDANYWIREARAASERPASHDCGRPANLPQYHPDRKPVFSQQAAPSPTTEEIDCHLWSERGYPVRRTGEVPSRSGARGLRPS